MEVDPIVTIKRPRQVEPDETNEKQQKRHCTTTNDEALLGRKIEAFQLTTVVVWDRKFDEECGSYML